MLLKICIAMLAFAANSVLCRLALAESQIDPMSFSLIRVCSGAVVLLVLYLFSAQKAKIEWSLKNGFYLALYIVAFSAAYLHIDAGVGALLLFGTVQLSMVGYGLCHGEKINMRRGIGLGIAIIGIFILLLPGTTAPNLVYAAMMVFSGIGWAMYSITGKKMQNPLASTLANFVLAIPFVLLAYAVFYAQSFALPQGVLLAMLSGGLASSGAYVLWYAIVKQIDRVMASSVQLSVPCLAIVGGALFIGEPLSLRIVISAAIVLAGIGLVIWSSAGMKH
ncbi:DMT family transporter [Acinetobacter bouvetii]|uniref:Putative DMT superfamily transporter inner membrane protein n=1 Tax=Acinetobacter bouvetii TaxID=202951 RepID=A0A811GAW0_9GAMM|nr:DMT family transporter [Acinetobacter bouvetii]CAB1214674.1 putative DMT superfamily transporter inner membrane protein [Acinetobacter bouvetii]